GVVPPPGAQPFGQYPVMQPGQTTTPRPGLTPGIPNTPGTNPYQPGRVPGIGVPATTPGPPTYPGAPGMPGGPPVVPGAPVRPGGGGPGGGPGGG
ncbi:MAG TPA: response regulator, partial [Vicinamibacterales bacterium]|nr:response regulator [Vicinamibacterales bacterium]